MPRPRTISDAAILAAAARVIGRRGLAGLTFASLADEVGLAPATLVQRFGSKRELLLALATAAVDGVRRAFDAARDRGGGPLEQLGSALTHLSAGVDEPATLASHLGFLQLDLTDPDLRAAAATHAQQVQVEVAALLQEAVDRDDLRGRTDVDRLSRAVLVAYNGALILWGIDGEGPLAASLVADIHEVLAPHRP